VKRLFAIGAGVIVSAVIAFSAFAEARGQASKQGAKPAAWVVCQEHLVLHVSPPLTLSPHAEKFTSSDVLDSCSSSDPTIDRGIAIIKNTGPHGSCMAGGRFHGVGVIRWNNGKVTVVPDHVLFGGGIAVGQGKITAGTEFVGASFKAIDKVDVDQIVLGLCGSPVGVGILTADGEIQIGRTSIDGVAFAP
jgi:hypothetical protein